MMTVCHLPATIKKLESKSEKKDSNISSIQKKLQDSVLSNKKKGPRTTQINK